MIFAFLSLDKGLEHFHLQHAGPLKGLKRQKCAPGSSSSIGGSYWFREINPHMISLLK